MQAYCLAARSPPFLEFRARATPLTPLKEEAITPAGPADDDMRGEARRRGADILTPAFKNKGYLLTVSEPSRCQNFYRA